MLRQKKWAVYLMLAVMVLSACMLVPSREDEARCGTAVNTEAKLMKPENALFVDCSLPEEEAENVLLRTQENISAKDGSLQMMIRWFWTMIVAVQLLLCCAYGNIEARYGGYSVTLRYHIFYIHQLDGKKKTAFCNERSKIKR